MSFKLAGLAFVVALVAAGVMGFAIQRGATCTVIAIGEVVEHRRFTRFGALLEASLWVAGGIVLARALGLTMLVPRDFAIGAATVGGGVLLGLGAVINGACVFGAVARLGSGEWVYAATPLGFFLGCLSASWLMPSSVPLGGASPLLAAPLWVAAVVAAYALIRTASFVWSRRRAPRHAWTPHAATIVIAVAFVVMLLVAGPWAYTDALAEIAAGPTRGIAVRLALFAALLAGAVTGGWTAGLLRHRPPSWHKVGRCLVGGAVMALGSLLIPGSNDGLILLGLPLLQGHAWVAFAVMCATVAAALTSGRHPMVRS